MTTGALQIEGPDARIRATLLRAGHPCSPLLVCIHGGGCNGRYFDLPGFSLAKAAQLRGFDILMIHRPGHGGSALPRTATPIQEAAEILPELIESAVRTQGLDPAHIFLVGHSIGGALALKVVAGGRFPVRAVAVSGIGHRLSGTPVAWWQHARNVAPTALPSDLFFGPEGSYDWRAPIALRKAAEPWLVDDVREVLEQWPDQFAAVTAAITIPVHWRLAEHERIWRCDTDARRMIADSLSACPQVDIALLPEGGHLYELHKRSAEHFLAQLIFFERWCEPISAAHVGDIS